MLLTPANGGVSGKVKMGRRRHFNQSERGGLGESLSTSPSI